MGFEPDMYDLESYALPTALQGTIMVIATSNRYKVLKMSSNVCKMPLSRKTKR